MSKKQPSQRGRPSSGPKRVVITLRLAPELATAFKDHIGTLRPRPDANAVLEMLVEAYLEQAGKWPPASLP